MLIKIVFIIVLIAAAILIYAATKPDTFHVERSISIKAPQDKLFALINDFRQWDEWTPYNKDPEMKKTYSGSDRGVGAHYAWEGNKEVGKGEITITAAIPPNRIELELHMIEPFEGRNQVVFTLKAAGDSTNITWGIDGKMNFIAKVMGLFFSMDRMIGRDFEAGLAKLKTVAEK